jgi:hypothetical protein
MDAKLTTVQNPPSRRKIERVAEPEAILDAVLPQGNICDPTPTRTCFQRESLMLALQPCTGYRLGGFRRRHGAEPVVVQYTLGRAGDGTSPGLHQPGSTRKYRSAGASEGCPRAA